MVPIKDNSNVGKGAPIPGLRWLPPNQCYFAGDSRAQFHSKLFAFVDFGAPANTFLSVCGTKNEPSVEEVTRILLDNPHQFYELADGRDKCAFFCADLICTDVSKFPRRTPKHSS